MPQPERENPKSAHAWSGGIKSALLAVGCCAASLTVYWPVEGVPERDVGRFGTYGRGIWDFSPADVVAVGDGEPGPLVDLADLRIVPNPAQEMAIFAFEVTREGRARVEVYDVAGRRVAVPFYGFVGTGRTEVRFDLEGDAGGPLPNGMFLVRATTPDGVLVKKLRVVR